MEAAGGTGGGVVRDLAVGLCAQSPSLICRWKKRRECPNELARRIPLHFLYLLISEKSPRPAKGCVARSSSRRFFRAVNDAQSPFFEASRPN